jgi:hypothetical protein
MNLVTPGAVLVAIATQVRVAASVAGKGHHQEGYDIPINLDSAR